MLNRSLLAALIATGMAANAGADIIITEVLPGVSTHADTGDTVELFNTGPNPEDITGYFLTDMDDGTIENNLDDEGTFAPAGLNLPALQPGEFAVVIFSASDEDPNARFVVTNFGLRIWAPLATSSSSFLGTDNEQLLLLDDTLTPLDSLAWYDTNTSVSTDHREDLAALTAPTSDYDILNLGNAAWAGNDSIANTAAYQASAVDFTPYQSVSTYGGGVLRRRSTNGAFQIGAPDSAADWEAVPREEATLGNPSDRTVAPGTITLYRITDFIDNWIAELESSNFPERRVARGEDKLVSDFVPPLPADHVQWSAVWDQMVAGNWEQANHAAAQIGYEVVDFLDLDTNDTMFVLREIAYPGEPGFRGQGIFVYDPNPDSRSDFLMQAPHPINDQRTIDELGLAIPQLRPRVSMIAGTHRNNHTSETLCDGTLSGGAKYRISDVAHHENNFFHSTHKYFRAELPNAVTVQLHGFCCPGNSDYPNLTHDVIVSNGFDDIPLVNEFARLLSEQIDALTFSTDDGSLNGDLTTAGLYGETAEDLGGTNNLQGRITNGVPEGDECNAAATTWNGLFVHVEQDPDVREEPQHIIDAMLNTLSIYNGPPLLVDLESLLAEADAPGAYVAIRWDTSAEFQNAGFNVYEGISHAGSVMIGARLNTDIIAAEGSETAGASYEFLDTRPLVSGEKRWYYLEDVEFGGKKTLHGPVRAGFKSLPQTSVEDWSVF